MKIKEKNGFTLIELLAVIIILGILMIIAIPSVTSYINNSRKSAYVDTAREIISGARSFVNEGKVSMYDTSATYYIKASCISTENGQRSPYGEFVDDETYVIVTYDGKGYDYYWVSRDSTGQGVPTPTSQKELDEDDIQSDIVLGTIIPTKISDDKSNVQVINAACNKFDPAGGGGTLKTNITITAKDQIIFYGDSINPVITQVLLTSTDNEISLSSITLTSTSTIIIGKGEIIPSNAIIVDKNGNDVTDNYNIIYKNGELTVNKHSPTIKVLPRDITYGKDEVIKVNTPNDFVGYCLARINGTEYTANSINGTAKIIIPNLEGGTYQAAVSCVSTYEKYSNTDVVFTSFKVNSASGGMS